MVARGGSPDELARRRVRRPRGHDGAGRPRQARHLLQPRRHRLPGVRAALPEPEARRGRQARVRLALPRLIEGLGALHRRRGSGDELQGAFFEFKNERIYARAEGRRGPRRRGEDPLRRGQRNARRTRKRSRKAGSTDLDRAAHPLGRVRAQQVPGPEPRRHSRKRSGPAPPTSVRERHLRHSNNAHLVRDTGDRGDPTAAYWKLLEADKTLKPTAEEATALSPAPVPAGADDTVTVFSPRTDLDALEWYAELAGGAERALFMTFAFGMNERFVEVYDRTDDVLRFALMEKKGNGRTFKAAGRGGRPHPRPAEHHDRGGRQGRAQRLRPLAAGNRRGHGRSARPLRAHQVHAGRSARARTGGRGRLGQLLQGVHGQERREHARHPRQPGGRRRLPRRVHAPVLATTPSASR